MGWLTALLLLQQPAVTEELRISPDDLRLRAAVSQQLPPSLRLQLRDLAQNQPLSESDGVLQTEGLLSDLFARRQWSPEEQTLVRYYFLTARLEQSRRFNREFERRRTLTREGIKLMESYIAQLTRVIARAVFVTNQTVDLGPAIAFPLTEVGWQSTNEERRLVVLHRYPEASTALGRETLRKLRAQALDDVASLERQLDELDQGEQRFLAEIHLLGEALRNQRAPVAALVRQPRAGLPFSF